MIIIPARISSTRFPKKALYPIDGIPMVVRVAQRAQEVDEVVVATDSKEIADVVKRYGFEAVMTSAAHQSGTDRVNEAAAILGLAEDEIIVNVQGDEPFIEPEVIKAVQHLGMRHPEAMMSSAYKNEEIRNDPNSVKVVLDSAGFALYFSRSLIPYPREEFRYMKVHLGIYAYTRKMLERFCSLAIAPLERIEGLEQLRALYYGFKIAMVEVESQSIGIDTPDDLKRLKM